MSRQHKPLSMMESCEVFQRRNRLIFGERILAEQQELPKTGSRSFEKDHENRSPFKNSNTLSNHLPPVNERQTRQSRSRSKMTRVARPQHIKHSVFIRHRTSQRQRHFPNIQGQQRKPQQVKMVPAKPSIARQNDAEENTEGSGGWAAFKGHTMINRPCLAHTSLAVPGTRTTIPQNEKNARHLKPETVLARHEPSAESKQSTEKHQGAISQRQKAGAHPSLAVPGITPRKFTLKKETSGRHLKPPSASAQQNPRENKQSIECATKQEQKQRARGDGIKPTGGRRVAVADMNQQGRQETREQCSGRRIGQCAETDPAQQQLTFIRVLRKRF